MKKQNIRTATIGIMVICVVPFMLLGCNQNPSQKPAGGYPGGQKSGAVNNATSDPNYASHATQSGGHAGAVNNATSAPGYPGSGGQ